MFVCLCVVCVVCVSFQGEGVVYGLGVRDLIDYSD